jgi:thiol-disulfide isomerase/thioredoxin
VLYRFRHAALAAALLFCAAGLATAAELKAWSGGSTPPLILKDLKGETHDLRKYAGSVVLINFWATWCEPCRDEMPAMRQLKAHLAGKPFVVLAVNVAESENRIADFLTKMPLDFTILQDRNSEALRAWKVKGLPASFIVGPDGAIRYSLIGEYPWADDSTTRLFTRLMPPR